MNQDLVSVSTSIFTKLAAKPSLAKASQAITKILNASSFCCSVQMYIHIYYTKDLKQTFKVCSSF